MSTSANNVQEILVYLALHEISYEDCGRIIRAAKESQSRSSEREAKQWKVGDKVQFEGRRKKMLFGTIHKVNKTTVTVHTTDYQCWRVFPELLKRCDKLPEPPKIEIETLNLKPGKVNPNA